MSKVGRPRALDEAKRREICALVSAGAGMRRAAQYVGVSQSTISREARRDDEFREQLRKAKATHCLTPLQSMRQALQSNWRAAAWMLERSDPEQFGRSHRHAFGRRELTALARDLIMIVQDEVDHPLQRENAIERMRATINYAMHHAWDNQRSGKSLSQAMDYFAKMKSAQDDWADFENTLGFPSETPDHEPPAAEDIASREDKDFAKRSPLADAIREISSRITDSPEESAA